MSNGSPHVAGVAMTPFGKHLEHTLGDLAKDVSTRAASLYRKKACFWVACSPPARSLATADTVPGQMPRGLERARFRRSQTAM